MRQAIKGTERTDRLLIITSFSQKPGMIGRVERTRELYGKVTLAPGCKGATYTC